MSELLPGAAAAGSVAWAGRKLMGPLFDEIGRDLAERYATRRQRNLERIVEAALRRAGSALDEPGEVPPRMLGLLLAEGTWAEDDLLAEYWGGIAAASRSPDGRDDRGIPLAKLVARMSALQVRAHYLLYEAMRRTLRDAPPFDPGSEQLLSEMSAVYVPMSEFAVAMNLSRDDVAALSHTMIGLDRESLLGHLWAFGPIEDIERAALIKVEEPGVVASASFAGAELFMWAHGVRDATEFEFADPSVVLYPPEGLSPFDDRSVWTLRNEPRLDIEDPP